MVPNGGNSQPLFFLRFEFVRLSGDHHVSPVMELQPIFEFQVLFHPTPTRVEYQEAQQQRLSMQQVLFDERLPLKSYFLGDAGESVSWQIDKVKLFLDPIKIYQLRAARFRAGESQPRLAGEAIHQAGLAHVTPSQKGNLRECFGRKLIRSGCASHKCCVHGGPKREGPDPNRAPKLALGSTEPGTVYSSLSEQRNTAAGIPPAASLRY